ncbi:MAG: T9SS type A sorting domain-containing protein [Bacteroidota bacterium]
MRTFIALIMGLLLVPELPAQVCPQGPPVNPFLADSPWPIYHRNNYAQASTCYPGPVNGDNIRIKYKSQIKGGTSPWVYFSDKYPNGERVLLYSNSTHVFKLIDDGNTLVTVDSLRIDFDAFTSFGWNFLLAKDKIWFTYDPKYDPEQNQFTRLIKLGDVDPQDSRSEIRKVGEVSFGDFGINKVQHFSMNYRGQIVFNSDNDVDKLRGTVGVISQDLQLLDTLQFITTGDEITNHNAFPIDENNSFYITTNKRLIKFDWDGTELSIDWEAPYDFVNDGPVGTFAEGSGTTPTLIGWGAGNDKLVVMSDGHAKNNLVAFWRELPVGWTGVPGMDIHFADSIQLPAARTFSQQFQSIENSPTAYGYDIAIAQFNGFLGYDCDNLKGVQKIRWDTQKHEFNIQWVNDDINMNGVLTYSQGTNMVYGSGKEEDCNYYYYGLDWETGELAFRQLLGPEGSLLNDPFYDGGNNNIIDEEGNIYFAGGASLVKLEVDQSTTSNLPSLDEDFSLYPNPVSDLLYFPNDEFTKLQLFDIQGRVCELRPVGSGRYDISYLKPGIYLLRVETQRGLAIHKVMKD